MPNRKPDTKVFCLTSGLSGGISVLQLYGPGSLAMLKQVFFPLKQNFSKVSKLSDSKLLFGHIRDSDGDIIDEVIVRRLNSSELLCLHESYHICCHGGSATLNRLSSLFASIGVPVITLNVFLKDLQKAKKIGRTTGKLLNRLPDASTDLMGNVLLNVLSHKPVLAGTGISVRHNHLVMKHLSVSPVIVLYGRTNSGKSTLMNVLSAETRSIVAPLAGTTRDSIMKHVSIGGVVMQLIDTAGVMRAKSELARLSIGQSIKCLKKADLILLVCDVSKKDTGNALLKPLTKQQKARTVIVMNKTDLLSNSRKNHSYLPQASSSIIYISALKETGITELKKLILLKLGFKSYPVSEKQDFQANNSTNVSS